MGKMAKKAQTEVVEVSPPEFREVELTIVGTAPLVQLRFSQKAKNDMLAQMLDPGSKKRGKDADRKPKDLEGDFQAAYYHSEEGRHGIPAMAIKNALLEAATLVGITKTAVKKTVFVQPDGVDAVDGTPLVWIEGDGPHPVIHHVRNANGVADLRVRAMWKSWRARVRVSYDASVIRLQDVVNLLLRAGMQVGIGEGRPASKNSAGMGWGTFTIAQE